MIVGGVVFASRVQVRFSLDVAEDEARLPFLHMPPSRSWASRKPKKDRPSGSLRVPWFLKVSAFIDISSTDIVQLPGQGNRCRRMSVPAITRHCAPSSSTAGVTDCPASNCRRFDAKFLKQRRGFVHNRQRLRDALRGHMHRAGLFVRIQVDFGQAFQIAVERDANQLAVGVHHRAAVVPATDIGGGNEVEFAMGSSLSFRSTQRWGT